MPNKANGGPRTIRTDHNHKSVKLRLKLWRRRPLGVCNNRRHGSAENHRDTRHESLASAYRLRSPGARWVCFERRARGDGHGQSRATDTGRRNHRGRATPFLRDAPTAVHYNAHRQRTHLSKAKRCSNEAGHLITGRTERGSHKCRGLRYIQEDGQAECDRIPEGDRIARRGHFVPP